MKYLGFILVVALIAGQVLSQRNVENLSSLRRRFLGLPTSGDILEILEFKLRKMVREGNETLGVPRLDIFRTNLLELELLEDGILGDVELRRFKVEGASKYNVNEAKVSKFPPKMTVGLKFPRIHFTGLYKVDGKVPAANLTGFGEGKITGTITDLTFRSEVYLPYSVITSAEIESIKTKASIGGLSLSVTGVLKNKETSDMLSKVLSESGPQLLEDNHDLVVTIVCDIIQNFLNKRMKGKPLSAIMAIFD